MEGGYFIVPEGVKGVATWSDDLSTDCSCICDWPFPDLITFICPCIHCDHAFIFISSMHSPFMIQLHFHPLHAFTLHDPFCIFIHSMHSSFISSCSHSPFSRFGLHENWGPVFVNWLYIQNLAFSNYRWQRLIKVTILLIRGPDCLMSWFIYQGPFIDLQILLFP